VSSSPPHRLITRDQCTTKYYNVLVDRYRRTYATHERELATSLFSILGGSPSTSIGDPKYVNTLINRKKKRNDPACQLGTTICHLQQNEDDPQPPWHSGLSRHTLLASRFTSFPTTSSRWNAMSTHRYCTDRRIRPSRV
jgi:hypothetical protein